VSKRISSRHQSIVGARAGEEFTMSGWFDEHEERGEDGIRAEGELAGAFPPGRKRVMEREGGENGRGGWRFWICATRSPERCAKVAISPWRRLVSSTWYRLLRDCIARLLSCVTSASLAAPGSAFQRGPRGCALLSCRSSLSFSDPRLLQHSAFDAAMSLRNGSFRGGDARSSAQPRASDTTPGN